MRRDLQRGLAWLGIGLALATGVALSTAGLAAGPARAAGDPVLADCGRNGSLTHSYSIAQLQQALSTMSANTRQYTSCPDVINRALAAAVAGPGGSGGGTGSTGSGSLLPTPVLVVLVVLVLGAVTLGALAVRRRHPPDPSG